MTPREDPEQRAVRILEAAGELILRWGYDKTTIDDVARAAGVAKGTIYLHWKTREDLFTAVLRHERVSMVAAVQHGVDDDPNGVTLAGVIRQLFVALEQRPLVKAFMLRDREVIGKLLRQARVSESKVLSRETLVTYLEVLHARGLVRTDLSVGAQANLIMATITGFLLAEPVLLDDRRRTPEDPADVVADVIARALDPGRRLAAAERRVVEQATREYVEQVAALSDAKYQSSLAVRAPARRRR